MKDRMEWKAYGEMERDANIYVWKNKMLGCVGRGGGGGAGGGKDKTGILGMFPCFTAKASRGR